MANQHPGRQLSPGEQQPAAQRSVTSKAFALLATFDTGHVQQSLTTMARRAGLPAATAHRLAGELLDWGALERQSGSYVIGHRLWQVGLLASVRQNIAEVAAPYMQDVLFVTQNVVNLFILDHHQSLLIERISGTRAGAPFRRVGARLPLHSSAAGKVLMAFEPVETSRLALPLAASTPRTITDPRSLSREIADVREQGYATTAEESGLDNFGLAVPVLSASGECLAALGVVSQGGPPSVGSTVPVLRIAARSIARRLTLRLDA